MKWTLEDFWRDIPVAGRAFISACLGGVAGGSLGSLFSSAVSLVGMGLGAGVLGYVVVRVVLRNG